MRVVGDDSHPQKFARAARVEIGGDRGCRPGGAPLRTVRALNHALAQLHKIPATKMRSLMALVGAHRIVDLACFNKKTFDTAVLA